MLRGRRKQGIDSKSVGGYGEVGYPFAHIDTPWCVKCREWRVDEELWVSCNAWRDIDRLQNEMLASNKADVSGWDLQGVWGSQSLVPSSQWARACAGGGEGLLRVRSAWVPLNSRSQSLYVGTRGDSALSDDAGGPLLSLRAQPEHHLFLLDVTLLTDWRQEPAARLRIKKAC